MFCYQSALLGCWELTHRCAATEYATCRLSLSLGARLMLASHLRKLRCGDSAGWNPGRQDDAQAAQQLPCSAATFRTATTFAILTVLAVTHTLHAQMHAKRVPRSLAAQHYTYNEQLWRRS